MSVSGTISFVSIELIIIDAFCDYYQTMIHLLFFPCNLQSTYKTFRVCGKFVQCPGPWSKTKKRASANGPHRFEDAVEWHQCNKSLVITASPSFGDSSVCVT
mmetsp:Transcript_84947/g.137743  ORF Transcript_84947/g.137743 Transcript_84947/m.137743 type:complete len:102 (-) Transcript_84947:507-812(-)